MTFNKEYDIIIIEKEKEIKKMRIISAEKEINKNFKNNLYYEWHFTISGKEEEIIISTEIIDDIIYDYLRRHTNLGR